VRHVPEVTSTPSPVTREWDAFRNATPAARGFVAATTLGALVLPWFIHNALGDATMGHQVRAVLMLLAVSVLNVELGRALAGGLERAHQPHKALSAWAIACAFLLPAPWLLLLVSVTYAHTWRRGMRIPVWKWAGSATFLVLCGCLAQVLAMTLMRGRNINWMLGDGGRGLVAVLLGVVAFLVLEAALFCGPAYLNHAEDEEWLRATLRSPTFYGTEAAVLLIGALLAAVWTGGPWFVLLTVPIYVIAQRAVLHEPLRQRAETAAVLAEKNAELERANQFQADLMGMLGHEIGNPLTSVMGYTEVGIEALEAGDMAFAKEALRIVDRGATQVQGVLNDVLALVATDRHALTATPEVVSISAHLHAAAANQPPQARPVVDCAPDLWVSVQPSHLDQMLANLLSNARKYADGATRICASAVDGDMVEITVTDQGAGVPEAFRGELFQRFTRDAASARGIRGTGLGLFITRELAQANGGAVALQSTGPSGSAFTLRLPAAPSPDPSA
jgi:signal transduction histidine kinase